MAASLLPMSRKLAEQKIEDQILMRKLEKCHREIILHSKLLNKLY